MVHAGGHNSPGSNPNPTHMNKFAFGCAVVASIISIIFGYGKSLYHTKTDIFPRYMMLALHAYRPTKTLILMNLLVLFVCA